MERWELWLRLEEGVLLELEEETGLELCGESKCDKKVSSSACVADLQPLLSDLRLREISPSQICRYMAVVPKIRKHLSYQE